MKGGEGGWRIYDCAHPPPACNNFSEICFEADPVGRLANQNQDTGDFKVTNHRSM